MSPGPNRGGEGERGMRRDYISSLVKSKEEGSQTEYLLEILLLLLLFSLSSRYSSTHTYDILSRSSTFFADM